MAQRKSYLKNSLNILSILIVVAIILAIVLTIFGEKSYNYRLDLSKVTLYSDENILEKISQLKDANTIAIVFDNSNKNYSMGSAVLYVQLFASQHKRIIYFIYDNGTSCSYSDSNTLQITSSTIDNCNALLKEYDFPIIKLGSIKKSDKTNVIIEDNVFNILPTTAEKSYEENHNFLEVIYPNIIDIETAIQNMVGKVSDYLNKPKD